MFLFGYSLVCFSGLSVFCYFSFCKNGLGLMVKCICKCVLIVLVTPLRKVTNDRKYIQQFQYKVLS